MGRFCWNAHIWKILFGDSGILPVWHTLEFSHLFAFSNFVTDFMTKKIFFVNVQGKVSLANKATIRNTYLPKLSPRTNKNKNKKYTLDPSFEPSLYFWDWGGNLMLRWETVTNCVFSSIVFFQPIEKFYFGFQVFCLCSGMLHVFRIFRH